MYNKKIEIDETIMKITSDTNPDFLENYVSNERDLLKDYCRNNNEFLESHSPIKFEKGPKIAKIMDDASKIANIGPMGAVAGTFSEITLNQLIEKGSSYSIVNNGGDIAFINKDKDKSVICGIYAGNSNISGKIAFKFKSSKKSYGLCTSSGTVGYSFSYGRADAVSIIAERASIADTLATSIANAVKGPDDSNAVEKGLEKAENYKEHFIGGIIIVNDSIGTIGKPPEIIAIEKGDLDEYYQDTIS
ncbi:UPF0280 family protein [Methanobrevibacter filiformis]|uniref:Uncharacterized protein n=1 Tax=Methanobrevibacter filiformis TaxID=55758 RepID=A0A166AM92_9EURY|nr:UPF0280 family protein [Methanobrevibacter filiformis]KZX12222.1 hypothetical protein MBFIL_11840 [Methanobrevibacter filiformis]